MEELKDLVYLLDRYAVRDINVITNPNKKKTKEEARYWDFYTGIQKDKWKTEEDAFRHFGYQSKSDKGFRRLKDGLKERLLNCAFFMDVDKDVVSEQDQKCQEAFKLAATAEFLYRRGGNQIYIEVCNKALNLAIEADLTHVVVHTSSLLRGTYAQSPKYSKEFDRVSKIFRKYYEMYKWEMEAQTDYLYLVSNLSNKKGFKKEYAPIAKEIYEKYSEEISKSNGIGYFFQMYARLIGLYSKVLNHQWKEGLIFCEDAVNSLAEFKQKARNHVVVFNTHKSSCLLMLGRYQEALQNLDESKLLISEGKPFWFKNREIAAITSLYAEKYQQAWDLVQMATKHDRFSTISEVDQETWRLYEGYLQLISRINKEEYWSKEDSAASKFRLNRLLNEMPLYSQDKRGGNIPMLILQILFYVTELSENKKAFDEIANRVEALRKYNDRNLDPDEEHVRSDCFISLLTLLPKFIYKPLDLAKAAHPLLAKMKGYQTDIIDNSFEVEVVPYERQWEWIMRYVNELSEKK